MKYDCENCGLGTRGGSGAGKLCRACYLDETVRKAYFPWDDPPLAPAPHPTDEIPGTDGKKRVMQHRLDTGHELFHPHDARLNRGIIEE